MFCDLLYIFVLKYFPFYKEFGQILSQMYIDLQGKSPFSLSDFNETLIFSTDFQKIIQILHLIENPSSGSRVLPCGRTDGQTHITKKFCDRNKNKILNINLTKIQM